MASHESIQSMAGRGDVDALRLSLAEALVEAAAKGNTACVEVLCSAKFDVNTFLGAGSPYAGWTALHLAARHGHTGCLLALLQFITDVDARNQTGNTPLMCAAFYGHTQCIVHLLSHGANVDAINRDGYTPLIFATIDGQTQCVVHLLSHGANIDAVDDDGDTALKLAVENQHVDIVRTLVAAGANVEIADDDKGTRALHYAAINDDPSCVMVLIDAGAEIDALDAEGKTPLQWAARHDRHMRSLVMLLRKGALMKFPAETQANVRIRTYLRMVWAAGGIAAYDHRRATSFAKTLRPFRARLPEGVILNVAAFL